MMIITPMMIGAHGGGGGLGPAHRALVPLPLLADG